MAIITLVDRYSDLDMQCPAEWYGGFKEARLLRSGEGERTASNPWTGEWTGAQFTFSMSDYDGRHREYLASAANRFWTAPLTYYMTTRENRALLGQAYIVFNGPIIEIRPTSPKAMEITLGDSVSQGLLSDQAQVPWRKIGDGFLSQLDAVSEHLDRGTPEPIIYGKHRRFPEDPASPDGFVYTPTYIGIETVAGDQWHVWLIAGHACADIVDVNTIDANGVATSVVGDEGTDWLIPHYAGFAGAFGAPYRDLASDTYGTTRRYTLLYGKFGEATPDACALGDLTLAVSVDGIEPLGDGTGNVITDRLDQYKHFLINFVANRGEASYQSGIWLANPMWTIGAGDVPIVDEDSFDACKAIGIERLPPDGYIGAWVIGAVAGDRQSTRTWIAEANRSCGVQFGITHLGRLKVFMLHPTAAIKAAAPLYRDANEILRGSFGTDVRWGDKANRIPFRTDYYHPTGTWLTTDFAAWDEAITQYGGEILGEVREYRFAPGITMAFHLARLEALVRRHPPRFVTLEATVDPEDNADSLGYLELGDYIRYRHFAAVGAPAEVRLAQIIRHQVQAGARRVLVEAFDCDDLIDYDAPAEETT